MNIESDLFGLTRTLTANDNIKFNDYKTNEVSSSFIKYPTRIPTTEQSRAIMPAWTARDLEQVNWWTLPLDPQEHVCIPFQNNLSSRILEKDYFVPHGPKEKDIGNLLPKH